jgi:YfiR/HmsC-like
MAEVEEGERERGAGGAWGRAAAVCLLMAVLLHAQGREKTEYEVEAAFLMNFTKFVDWPASAFRDPAAPLTICVIGNDPFGANLDQVVAGETVSGHQLAVQRIRQVPEKQTCQVLYVSHSENAAEIVRSVGPCVLTVGDEDEFLRAGGIIAFVLQARHVRFDINLQAAARESLSLSSRLLGVARRVLK